jgi:hypothetical protein
MAEIMVYRKAYTRKDGTRVKATTYLARDRGAPGKTPESKKWYEHDVEMNWHKEMPESTRRSNALSAHGGNELAIARALQALSNVTTDAETKRLARADADYFFARHSTRAI